MGNLGGPLTGPQRIDRRSLDLHRAIAEKLRARPELIEIAREPGALDADWRPLAALSGSVCEILERPLPEVLELLVEDSETMTAMRQATPFAGVLEPAERWAVYARFETGPRREFMTRAALEHIIRAAATIADVDEIVVVGSHAVLGEFPDAPAEFLVSNGRTCFPEVTRSAAT